MEKMSQVATLLLVAMTAAWVPARLARELSPVASSPFLPDYYSYEPISDFTVYEPISGDDFAPFSGDDIEPALGPYNESENDNENENESEIEEENEVEEALSQCWVELGDNCGDQVFNNFVNKKLAFTRNCCSRVRKVIEKPCWNTMFEELGLLGPFKDEIKGVCSGDLSRLPIEIHDQKSN